jgi:hypothetical protein
MPFVFAVAAHHPLAAVEGPLTTIQIAKHRIVAVGDTSRNLPARTHGVLAGQDVLVVPTMRDKLEAQIRGLGCGWLPAPMAQPHIESGVLQVRRPWRCAPRQLQGSLAHQHTRQGAAVVGEQARGPSAGTGAIASTAALSARSDRLKQTDCHRATESRSSMCNATGAASRPPHRPAASGLPGYRAGQLAGRARPWRRLAGADRGHRLPALRQGADNDILRTLAALGLHPDEPPVWQSRREGLYAEALRRLDAAGSSLSVRLHAQGNRRFARACASGIRRSAIRAPAAMACGKLPRAWRVRVPDGPAATICFDDRWQGRQCQNLETELGISCCDGPMGYGPISLRLWSMTPRRASRISCVAPTCSIHAAPDPPAASAGLADADYLHVPVVVNAVGRN